MLVILSPSQTHSSLFHSPTGLSTSSLPRKPATSSHAGSRPHQLIRPPAKRFGSPFGSKYHCLPFCTSFCTAVAVSAGWVFPLTRMKSPVPPSIIWHSIDSIHGPTGSPALSYELPPSG